MGNEITIVMTLLLQSFIYLTKETTIYIYRYIVAYSKCCSSNQKLSSTENDVCYFHLNGLYPLIIIGYIDTITNCCLQYRIQDNLTNNLPVKGYN